MNRVPERNKKQWVSPDLKIFGDMTTLTQQCPQGQVCKPKTPGSGDDFSNNISTVGGP